MRPTQRVCRTYLEQEVVATVIRKWQEQVSRARDRVLEEDGGRYACTEYPHADGAVHEIYESVSAQVPAENAFQCEVGATAT